MTENTNQGYQVTVVNIKYGKVFNQKIKNRPEFTILDIPDSICKIKNRDDFYDSVETFSYNTITKKYGAEVNRCQVYLP